MSQTMARGTAGGEHPSGDARYRMLDATIKRHRHQGDALIEILHTAQELFGHLSVGLLLYVAHALRLPPSQVYGVATFYHFFTFRPKAEHTCVVCLGTACYVKGADEVMRSVEGFVKKAGMEGRVSLDTARCLGACGLAPVTVFDGEVCGHVTAATAQERVVGWKADHGPR